MKEVLIRIRVNGEQILSAIETSGLQQGAAGKLELIGILEDMKYIELDKLKTKISTTVQVPSTIEVVDEAKLMTAEELLDSVNPDDYPDDEDDPIRL